MNPARIRLAPGTLWPALERTTRRALDCGAQRPIRTEQQTVTAAGVSFSVRVVSSLARKDRARRQSLAESGEPADPFATPEPELFVADLSNTHFCLLNKFNVIEHHLLIVTRQFEHQESLLTRADFRALAVAMAEYDALGFYNGGVVAGASQPHKHLQVVPLPLTSGGAPVPVEPLLEQAEFDNDIGRVPAFAFQHGLTRLERSLDWRAPATAEHLLDRYRALMTHSGLHGVSVADEPHQSGPYNLLVTRRWMLLIPRSREHFRDVSVNALGFAGSFFVRNRTQLKAIRESGPLAVLQRVGLQVAGQ